MTSLLPPNLLRLFAPRPTPQFLKPLTKDEANRGPNRLQGCAELVKRIRDEAEDAELQEGMADAPATKGESNGTAQAEQDEVVNAEKMDVDGEASASKVAKPSKVDETEKEEGEEVEVKPVVKNKAKGKQRDLHVKKDKVSEMGLVGQEAIKVRRELRKKRKEQYKKDLEKNYNPQNDDHAVGDPYKTLFISRLSRKATEADLRHEFEMYGAIERIRIIKDKKGKSRNYAFIVYERERDMKAAYKDADGIPIHHKRILVDVERGRTVKGWKPSKLGGGLGGRPKPVEKDKLAPAPGGPPPPFDGGFRGGRGGFRGGPRGGFRGGFGGGGGDFGGRGGFGGGRGGGFGGGRGGGGGGFGGGRGGFGGGDRGYGGQGGGFGGPPGGGFGGQGGFGGGGGGYGGPPGGGFVPQSNGFGGQQGFGGGGGGGFKRDFDGGGGGGGGYGGGGGGGPGFGGPGGPPGGGGGGGYDDRDSKRPRY